MILDQRTFHILHSEVIMFFQVIENDLKRIYAYMHKGDPERNWDWIKNKTLGQTIHCLQKLDNSAGSPDLSQADYDLLTEICEKRNWWAHENFLDFMYEDSPWACEAYAEQCEWLREDHARLQTLFRNVEQVRINLCNLYRR